MSAPPDPSSATPIVPWLGFEEDGLWWIAEKGALADAKAAEDGRIVAQCAYRPCGVSKVGIYVQARVCTSKTWISDSTTTSGCESCGPGWGNVVLEV